MKKIIVFQIIIFSLIPCLLQAQGWEKFYGSDDASYTDFAFKSASTLDGGLVILGSKTFPGSTTLGHLKLFVLKLDANGIVEWEFEDPQSLGSFVNPLQVLQTSDGNFLISYLYGNAPPNNTVIVKKISSSGSTIWEKDYSNTEYSYFNDLIELSDGGYVLMGDFEDGFISGGISVVRLNEDGSDVWTKEIIANNGDSPIFGGHLIQDSAGDLLITGYEGFSNVEQDAFLMKIDIDGDEIWKKVYNRPQVEFGLQVANIGTEYVIAGLVNPDGFSNNMTLLKVDSEGTEIWYKEYLDEVEVNSFCKLEVADDGGYVISSTGEFDVLAKTDMFLIKFDQSGEKEWINNFGRSEDEMNVSLLRHDQGYFLVGRSTTIDSDVLVYVVKTDLLGVSFTNTLSGKLFFDENLNCQNDNSELGLSQWLVVASKQSEEFYGVTDDLGNYSFALDTGAYEIEAFETSGYWNICNNNFTIDFSDFNQNITQDIGAQSIIDCPLMDVSISTPFLRRCFPNTYSVQYCNLGTLLAEDAYLEVSLDSFMAVISTSIPFSSQAGNTLTFDLGDVEVGACSSFEIAVQLGDSTNCDDLPLGLTHCVEAHIYPDSLCFNTDNWSGASLEVDAQCTGDSVVFTITNVGTAPMSEAVGYIVIEDDVILMIGNVELNIGESETISYAANGATYRLEVEQEVDHPGFSMPSVSVENCGAANSIFSTGFVNIFSPDDGDNFIDIDCQQNRGAYDPNDKRGFPLGYDEEHYISRGQALEYLVRFQNTGNDTAFNVVVRDTISEFLNIASVRPGASSHDYNYSVSPEGVLEFRFSNILLPDSTTNLSGSNGFVKFKISQNSDLAIGTEILNSAAIYFDFNAPIITNQTLHTIERPLLDIVSIDNVPNDDWNVTASPNPFESLVNFKVEGLSLKQSTFFLYNVNGQLIETARFEGQQYQMNTELLSSGMYFFTIQSNGGTVASGKIVRQ